MEKHKCIQCSVGTIKCPFKPLSEIGVQRQITQQLLLHRERMRGFLKDFKVNLLQCSEEKKNETNYNLHNSKSN
jgi:translation initiation factor RLI1